jgi:hypothetical protein
MTNTENLKDIAMVSSMISFNLFDEIAKTKNLSSIEIHNWISETAIEFTEKHNHIKDFDWAEYCLKNNFSDYEELVVFFAKDSLK